VRPRLARERRLFGAAPRGAGAQPAPASTRWTPAPGPSSSRS